MADEEKNETTEGTPAEEDSAADPVAADTPSEGDSAAGPVAADAPSDEAEASPEDATATPPADDAPSADEQEAAAEEEAPAEEETPAEEAPAAEAPAGDDGEAPEALSPKQQRKLARSTFGGEAAPSRTAEERAAERAERRRQAKESRRRVRARARGKKEAGTGTPPAEREPGRRKVRQGTVVSDKADKTITVEIELARRHPSYEKVVRRSRKLHAHDEANEAREGDVVRLIETRPLSRTKRWRLAEIVERAPSR